MLMFKNNTWQNDYVEFPLNIQWPWSEYSYLLSHRVKLWLPLNIFSKSKIFKTRHYSWNNGWTNTQSHLNLHDKFVQFPNQNPNTSYVVVRNPAQFQLEIISSPFFPFVLILRIPRYARKSKLYQPHDAAVCACITYDTSTESIF